jgi:excisionase family DNA binding protein
MDNATLNVAIVADGLLTPKEAALFLGISVAGLYKFMQKGDLIYTKLGRSRRIPKRAVVEFAASHLVVQ